VEVPEPAGEGVLVEVAAAGICGTDLHMMSWDMPFTFGHEVAGWLADGTAVAVQPMVACGSCEQCRAGQQQLCRTGLGQVYGASRDGGMADRLLVDPACLVTLPAGLDPRSASLVEPLAVSLHGINQAGIGADDRVLIVGGGTIGLLAAVAAQAGGAAAEVVARHPFQQEAVRSLGATLDAGEGRYDVVIDAAGTQSSFDLAVKRVRPGGTITIVGTWWEPIQIGVKLLLKEVRLVPASMQGHHEGRREVETAASLLAGRAEIAESVISHRFGLDEAEKGFEVAANRAAGAIKVVLTP
jgi:2-desacetyl-2-hydroxyethyl bacteriochlorophyllide A dehydrogenase